LEREGDVENEIHKIHEPFQDPQQQIACISSFLDIDQFRMAAPNLPVSSDESSTSVISATPPPPTKYKTSWLPAKSWVHFVAGGCVD
jgi:hypothetical protein